MKFIGIINIRDYLYTLCDDGNIYWVDNTGTWNKIEPPNLKEGDKNEESNSELSITLESEPASSL